MNPPHNSNQNPPPLQQVNSVINQQMALNQQQMINGNVGGLFPNNRPIVASSFINFPNQPFPLQNSMGQFPNGIGGFNPQPNFYPFPMNQFNASQQQQGQFFAHNSMNPAAYNQNVIMQNAIQNISQLLQLQNAQFAPGNYPVFQNQNANVTGPQNLGFLANQHFGAANPSGPMQHASQGQQRFVPPMMDNASKQLSNTGQQLQGNQLLQHGSVQAQQAHQAPNLLTTLTNYQNQIAHSMVPQDPSFIENQLFGSANPNGPVQQANQGPQRFVSPMMNVNASKQPANTAQQLQGSSLLPNASGSVQTQQAQNPCPSRTNFQDNQGNTPANINAKWSGSQRKNFTGQKKIDGSHKGFKPEFRHAKEKFGIQNGNMNKGCNSNSPASSVSRNSANQFRVEKKIPSPNYTEQEIKQWRESRKKHYPSKANVEKMRKEKQASFEAAEQEAKLRSQQLKEILVKQAELGCEVAEIPSSYLSGFEKQIPAGNKHRRDRTNKWKSRNKRATPLDHDDRIAKKPKAFKAAHRTTGPKPNQKEPSLLQKLLARDIKRDKSHLLQVFRFIVVNAFFTDGCLRFPSVIVRDSNLNVAEKSGDLGYEGVEKAVQRGHEVVKKREEEEEEGEITD